MDAKKRTSIEKQEEVELEDLLRAFKTIQELPPDNPDSFFAIAAIHGAPVTKQTRNWYCHHRTVLFPPWHRPYLQLLEDALRKCIPEPRKNNFRLPYWDQTSQSALEKGLPDIFLREKVTIDGEEVPNPLRSFKLPVDVTILGENDNDVVVIPKDSLVERGGWPTHVYQENLKVSLRRTIVPQFSRCQNAQSWFEFATTMTSGISVETPHNSLHNFLGGYPHPLVDWNSLIANEPLYAKWPKTRDVLSKTPEFQEFERLDSETAKDFLEKWEVFDKSTQLYHWVEVNFSVLQPHRRALSEVDISSYDPLFYFHHANIDRFYWSWQRKADKDAEKWTRPDGATDGFQTTDLRGLEDEGFLTLETTLNPFNISHLDLQTTPFDGYDKEPEMLKDERLKFLTVNENMFKFKGKLVAHLWRKVNGMLSIIAADRAFTRLHSFSCPNCVANPKVSLSLVLKPKLLLKREELLLEVNGAVRTIKVE